MCERARAVRRACVLCTARGALSTRLLTSKALLVASAASIRKLFSDMVPGSELASGSRTSLQRASESQISGLQLLPSGRETGERAK